MRPEHSPVGSPCDKCGEPAARHRKRASRASFFRQYNAKAGRRASAQPRTCRIIALDGEGYTTPDGAHLYTYMAACDEKGLVSCVENPAGLTAPEVCSFITRLPKEALLVGFALGYDRTKWLESWPDAALWHICRPEQRAGETGPLPVRQDGYSVNLVSTRFSVRTLEDKRTARTVWDVWKFFQSSFVKALERWKVGTEQERALITKEKNRRKSFTRIGNREKTYCQLECKLLAMLVRGLIDAHEAEGLRLRSYYGPGSSADIVLAEHGEQRAVFPPAMAEAVMCAYFGGRFEVSRVGPVEASELYSYDITSAYPAAMARIPCMMHGTWRWRREWDGKGLALVSWRQGPHKRAGSSWGVLPHRMADGNILYPRCSAGGWTWSEEFRAAKRLAPGLRDDGAWTWDASCACPPPFKARIEELFAARLAWGKAARGLVLKLLLNSLYGKSAQKVGKGRFRCMVRAGLITSMTRAALLQALETAKDPASVLELATDSVLSTEPLPLERPGLGGWERKAWQGGVFLMRPGLRFALDDLDGDRVAARGVGTRNLKENRAKVLGAWKARPLESVVLQTPSFFHGAKLEVRRKGSAEWNADEALFEYTRSELYGLWTDEQKTLSYAAAPKRELVRPDYSLSLWDLPGGEAFRSFPYGGVKEAALVADLENLRDIEAEQPDAGGLSML